MCVSIYWGRSQCRDPREESWRRLHKDMPDRGRRTLLAGWTGWYGEEGLGLAVASLTATSQDPSYSGLEKK